MTSEPWTAEMNARLVEMWAAGKNTQEIARALGVGTTTIGRHVRKLELTPRRKTAVENSKPRAVKHSGLPDRKCLRCREPFGPETRFMFMCTDCRRCGI